jgi:hypothetical protein
MDAVDRRISESPIGTCVHARRLVHARRHPLMGMAELNRCGCESVVAVTAVTRLAFGITPVDLGLVKKGAEHSPLCSSTNLLSQPMLSCLAERSASSPRLSLRRPTSPRSTRGAVLSASEAGAGHVRALLDRLPVRRSRGRGAYPLHSAFSLGGCILSLHSSAAVRAPRWRGSHGPRGWRIQRA